MKDIRIGNDINVKWSIFGDGAPYILEGKDVSLYLCTPFGKRKAEGFSIVGNQITWTFAGKDQSRTGKYSLELVVNADKEGQVTTDACNFVNLVNCSCKVGGADEANVTTESIELTSELGFLPYDDTEIRNEIKKKQDALVSGKNIKTINGQSLLGEGDIVIEGGSYDDTGIKKDISDLKTNDALQDAELAKLSEENERLKERLEEQDQFIEDLQNTKIDRENDDYYPKMAVGLADNLAGVDVVDSEINFRRSGGGAISDGVARIETIKGNSVVWNQLYNRTPLTTSGMTMTIDGNTTIINGVTTASFFGIKAGVRVSANKMLMVVQCLANPDGLSFNVADLNSAMTGINVTASAPNGYAFYTGTYRANGNALGIQRFGDVGTAFNNVKIVVSLYDLTKKFGAGNEPTTIEEFYARIPMGIDEYAYNEGEVIHMDVQSIESVGVNQWDEEWESGVVSQNDGQNYQDTTTNSIRSKNYCSCLPNTSYCVTSNATRWARIFWYDKARKYISFEGAVYGEKEIKSPSNAAYFRISPLNSYGTTYNHDICINLSDVSVNGKYYPYIKRVEDLSIVRKYFPQGMKSAGSAHDEIRYNKATQKWEYSKGRMKEVDMGTLTWRFVGTTQGGIRFKASVSDIKPVVQSADQGNILCAKYDSITADGTYFKNKGIAVEASKEVSIYDEAYTDAAALKASLQGVILYYESNDWEWVELDAEDQFKDLDYQVWNCGTEKAIAEGKSAPLAADITYGFNAIGKIKELESLVAALRAKVGI